MRLASLAVLVTAVFTTATGCGDDSPTSPSPTLTISGPGELLIGETRTFTAMLGPQPVQPSWSSNQPGVARVDPATGLVAANANGRATITATYQNQSAVAELRVVPDYRGQWTGRISVVDCGREAAFPIVNFCSTVLAALPPSLQLNLIQTGATPTATINLAGGMGPVQGSIEESGELSLRGNIEVSGSGATMGVGIDGWRTSMEQPAGAPIPTVRMVGRFTMVWTAPPATGRAFIEATLLDVVRTP